jgi:uncharacterized protein (TIGR00369 family)
MSDPKLDARETAKVVRAIPFNKFLGMRLSRLHRDGVTVACDIQRHLLNRAGMLHGGVSAALADAAVGIAIHRHFGGRRAITTIEMKINYFRPVAKGRAFARSRLHRIGSTLCVGSVDIADGRRQAIGTAIVTYMILAEPKIA